MSGRNMDGEGVVEQNTRIIRISYSDPNATDSSDDGDHGEGTLRRRPKKITRKIALQIHLHHENGVFLPKQLPPSPPSISAKMNNQKLTGVRMTKSTKFSASIKVKKRHIWLGRFKTPKEASAAYLPNKHGKNRKIELRVTPMTRRFARLPRTGNNSWARCATAAAGVSKSKVVGQENKELPQKKKRSIWVRSLGTQKASKKRDQRTGRFLGPLRIGNSSAGAGDYSSSGATAEVMDIESDDESGFGFLNGVRVIDKNGFLMGKFSKIDDLSICWGENNDEDEVISYLP